MPRPGNVALFRGQHGQVLVIMVASLVLFLGVAALAIDSGILFHARSEAQRTADAAALAAAGILLQAPDAEAEVVDTAIRFAALNTVRGEPVVVLPEDVTIIRDSMKVRVRVQLTHGRGSAVPTVFARILGFDAVRVNAMAAAASLPAATVNCMFPIAIPDRWSEGPSPALVRPTDNDAFGDDPTDFYSTGSGGTGVPSTAYGVEAVGSGLRLRQGPMNGGYGPGVYPIHNQYIPIRPLGGDWVDQDYKYSAVECVERPRLWSAGEGAYTDDLNIQQYIGDAAQMLINQDPGARWNEACGCVHDSRGRPNMGSPRLRTIALFDPRRTPSVGMSSMMFISGFAGVFIETVMPGPHVMVRLTSYAGSNAVDLGDPTVPSLIRVTRLVQ